MSADLQVAVAGSTLSMCKALNTHEMNVTSLGYPLDRDLIKHVCVEITVCYGLIEITEVVSCFECSFLQWWCCSKKLWYS